MRSKLRQALIAVLGGLKASDPLVIASSAPQLRTRLEQAPSLFKEIETWFTKLEALDLQGVALNKQGRKLAERLKIGVKGALTAPKDPAPTVEEQEKPRLGRLDDDREDEELEERAEQLGRLRA